MVKKYRVKVRITSDATTDLSIERIQKAVGATYEKILVDLKIPYNYIEVEVEEIPQLHIAKNGQHKA